MLDTLEVLPFEFWLVVMLLAIGFLSSAALIKKGVGVPMAVVLATVTVWYVVDVFYNDYAGTYFRMFPSWVLTEAWWQIIVFLIAFLVLAPLLNSQLNKRHLATGSQVWLKFKNGVAEPEFQKTLNMMFRAALLVWVILIIAAALRYQGDLFYFFFPYLGKHPGPWLTSGVGGGVNSLLALATNFHMLVGAVFGVVAALSTDKKIRKLAIICVLLSWPLYLFDRTRGYILLIVIPGILAWVFLRLRGGLVKKISILMIAYLIINAWFGFIIAVRSTGSVTSALFDEKISLSQASEEHHQGLNMFEELCWIIELTDNGRFNPNPGENYVANLVNLIPRTLWPSKPTIGINYAIARGMGGNSIGVGVYATLSQGVIGQGLVNFRTYYGPVAAALLMALWACWLARVDLLGHRIGYIPLLGMGLILTFNMGRDITLMNLYPFLFGYVICVWINKKHERKRANVELEQTRI